MGGFVSIKHGDTHIRSTHLLQLRNKDSLWALAAQLVL